MLGKTTVSSAMPKQLVLASMLIANLAKRRSRVVDACG